MRCIICHNDYVGLKILAMRTRCRKRLIAYHKFNGITSMKRHVEGGHYAFMKRLAEDPSYIVVTKAPINRNVNKKRAHFSI
jgi:hypothetical protein